MKKYRHITFKSLLVLILAMFTISMAYAQEVKEEKAMKIKVVSADDDNFSLDTSFTLPEDFDGDWSTIIDDEEILKQLEELNIDMHIDGEAKVYMVRAPHTQKKGYFYAVDTDEEGEVEVNVEVESGNTELHEIMIKEIDGDSTISIIVKTDDCKKGTKQEVMVWHSDEGGEQKEYKVITIKADHMNVEKMEGDSVTYRIMTDGGEGDEGVMFWTSDDVDADGKIMIKEVEGDSMKVFITTSGDVDGDVKVIKKKEIIIITDEEHEHDCDHDHDKDKKKKKKKKKDDD